MTKYPLLSLGTALLTTLASCATITYEQVNLPTSFKTYGPDYQFRVLNLEEKTTISILDENKEEKSLTADEKYYYIVLTIEIVRLEVDTQSEDEALSNLGMTLKHHTGSAAVGNYQPVEDYSWLGEVISVGTTRDFDVAFLIARDHGVTKKPLFFEFDILITAEDVDVQLNTKKAM